jgi:integrase
MLKLLRSIFLAAVEDRLIATTPARKIVLPRTDRPRIVPLTITQVRSLAAAMPERTRAMVITQAGLGLRIGELPGLRVQDVDFLRRTVRIESQIRQHDRERVETKTQRAKRPIPLPRVVAEVLALHIAKCPPGEDGTIFYTGSGHPWRQDYYASRMFRKAVRAAKLPEGITSHDLRHHYVSVMLDAGASVVEVAELIGDTVAVVMETYAHLMPGREDRARQMIDKAWDSPDTSEGQEKAP